MFERLVDRAERLGRVRARALSARLAERIQAELPADIAAEASEAGVRLSGPRLGARLALDARLRWLAKRVM